MSKRDSGLQMKRVEKKMGLVLVMLLVECKSLEKMFVFIGQLRGLKKIGQ